MSKSYDLFEKKYSIQLAFRNYKFNELKNINTNKQWQKNEIDLFLRRNKTLSDKQINIFIDSISKNELLFKKYLDSSFNYKFTNDSILFFNNKNWQTDSRYIIFHSKLITQRSYDTIRAYYDRHYKNSLAFYEPVLIALINMGDPEVRAKYDSLFEDKIRLKSFGNDDLDDLTKFTEGYRYYKLSKLLFIDDIEVLWLSDSPPMPINAYIAFSLFPGYCTQSITEYYKTMDSILGTNYMQFDKKNNKRIFKFNKSYSEISQYFLDYALYMQKKEQEMYDKIRYKTEK
jgi:hypothetical protein